MPMFRRTCLQPQTEAPGETQAYKRNAEKRTPRHGQVCRGTGNTSRSSQLFVSLSLNPQACLWHLDMETFKMTCFAKLSVPARVLGQSMDVLNSLGVLRMEKTAAAAADAAATSAAANPTQNGQQGEGTTSPRAEGAVSYS